MTVETYDIKSYDLAEYFLEGAVDRKDLKYKSYADDLAKHIQQVVEDWFETNNLN